jgi:hypothetical protein
LAPFFTIEGVPTGMGLSLEERLVSTLSLQLLDTTEMQAIEQDIPFSVFKSSLGQVIRGRVDYFIPLTAK